MLDHLNEAQKREVMREIGNPQGISPEGVAHAIEGYLASLELQADAAKSFFFGRLEEGFEQIYDLPEEVRAQIDALIWEAAGGEAIDPTLPESQQLIASSILFSMEMRMGMHCVE